MNKTVPTDGNVISFLANLEDQTQRQDSETLIAIMHEVSGEPPVLWGTSIVGFGLIHYKYASGREGDTMKIGFSPRKGKLSLYVTVDASQYENELAAIGPHEIGKGCIYIKKLADVDVPKLTDLIRHAYNADVPYDTTA
jgi:hypothetical protein